MLRLQNIFSPLLPGHNESKSLSHIMCYRPQPSFSLDSLHHVSNFLTLLCPNPHITLPMCPYKGQRGEITISLNVLAMILKQYVGKPSLLQHSTCSAWEPPPHVLQICFPVSQPPDFVLHGFILHHIVCLAKISAICDSTSPACLDPSKKQPCSPPSKLFITPWFEFCFGTLMSNSVSLLTGKYIKSVLITGKMSFITGYQWDFTEPASPVIWPQSLYSTHLVYWLDLDFWMKKLYGKSNENLVTVKANDVHWFTSPAKPCLTAVVSLQKGQFAFCQSIMTAVILLFFKGPDADFRKLCSTTFPETKVRLRVSKILLFVLFEMILVSSVSTLRCTSFGPIIWLIGSL